MELLEAADIDPSHVINADRRIDVPRMQRFWRLAVETTNDENFGLHAADQLHVVIDFEFVENFRTVFGAGRQADVEHVGNLFQFDRKII